MPHQVCHAHCPKGGGGAGAVLLVLAVVVIAATARPVVHAAEVVLEVVLITAVSVAGLAALAGMAYAAVRIRRWQAVRRQAIPRFGEAVQAVTGPHRPAIEAPRAVIDGTVIADRREERQP